MSDHKRKIAFVTGSRGEYGYIRPVLRALKDDPDVDHEVIVANMHLLDEFGYSVQEIEKDGFHIGARIANTFDGYNPASMTKSLGVFLLQLPEVLSAMKPDIIVIAGDRGEQLMAAIAGAHMYIPVAHIQAGELSGNIDGTTRHAITKFAHIHFAGSKDAADRVHAMGEQEFRIHQTGAPMLDELVQAHFTPREEILKKYRLDASKPIFLFVQHPVTEDFSDTAKHVEETLAALDRFGTQTVGIFPNSDAGSKALRAALLRNTRPWLQTYRNLPREDYLGLMNVATVMVGNSSSAIIEGPTMKLPGVNVGRRQEGRERSTNVIDVPPERDAIEAGIRRAMTEEFRAVCGRCVNPYGDGRSGPRIAHILKSIPITEELVVKKLRY